MSLKYTSIPLLHLPGANQFTDMCPILYLLIANHPIKTTSSNGNIFHDTGPLWGESIGQRGIPLTKVSDAELWCFLKSAPEQTIEQAIETPVIWDGAHYDVTVMWSNMWWRIDGQVRVPFMYKACAFNITELNIYVIYWILKRSSDLTSELHSSNL